MKQDELLKFIKEKKILTNEHLNTFGITSSEINTLCDRFNWTPIKDEDDSGEYIYFVDTTTEERIEDFSEYNFDNEFRTISVQFTCKEDLKKFADLFPTVNMSMFSKRTTSVTVYNDNTVEIKNKHTADKPYIITDNTLEYFKHWKQMPEYFFDFKMTSYLKVPIRFKRSLYPNEKLSEIFGQTITKKTDSIWFPKKEVNDFNYYRVLGGHEDPEFPIYIVSKGRSFLYRNHNSYWLSKMKIHHYICVEPSDFENYDKCKLNESEYCHILQMDMKYKGLYNTLGDLGNSNSTGSGAARNFCADHAKNNGFHWCWIFDDNVYGFWRMWRGHKILSYTPETFRSLERFVQRYTNIGLAGFNYHMFVVNEDQRPPFTTNSKIYSFGLWNLDCPFVKQEGRYNEDVIQSLKILETGKWTTVQYNAYLGMKLRTQLFKGGNTEEIYGKQYGGTFSKTQMLVERFPQYAKLVWKFRRWHHEVDYSSFTQKLEPKPEFKDMIENMDYNEIEENGAYIVKIPKELHLSENDNREYLEAHFPKGCPEDITNSNIDLLDDIANVNLRNFRKGEVQERTKVLTIRPTKTASEKPKILENPLFSDEEETKTKSSKETKIEKEVQNQVFDEIKTKSEHKFEEKKSEDIFSVEEFGGNLL